MKLQLGIEFGERYIKFPNGTAICWNTHSFYNCNFVQNGNEYRYTLVNQTLNFPIKFVSVPVITMQTASDADYSWCNCMGVTRNESGISQLCFTRGSASTGGAIYFHYIAIGKWK